MTTIETIIIAIVEGLTEFLPVSSTGHMIIAQGLMGIPSDDFVKMFTVNIQFGAILSVVVLYWKRFFQTLDFYLKLLVAFIPAAILGLLFGDAIDALLENVKVVAIMLIIGGVALLFIDRWLSNTYREKQIISNKTALTVGLFQCLALVPGVSRSAATIIGGLTQKLSRTQAAEFSFFLAVPTMFAATAYKLLKVVKTNPELVTNNISTLVLGNVIAFVVAMLAIKSFINFLNQKVEN